MNKAQTKNNATKQASTAKNGYTAAFDKMYEACLNATGIYKAVKLIGADKHLPGYEGCLKTLNEAIELAKKIKAV